MERVNTTIARWADAVGRVRHVAVAGWERRLVLGVLLAVAFWLYILGEMYFGAMAEAVRRSSRPMRLSFFWIRLIFTIGWALYPILQFVDLVIGAGHARPVIVLYTAADLARLATVATYRRLGLPLPEVRALLDGRPEDLVLMGKLL